MTTATRNKTTTMTTMTTPVGHPDMPYSHLPALWKRAQNAWNPWQWELSAGRWRPVGFAPKTSFSEALERLQAGPFAGLQVNVPAAAHVVRVELAHCVGQEGRIESWASSVLDLFRESGAYVEYTPDADADADTPPRLRPGDGLRLYVTGLCGTDDKAVKRHLKRRRVFKDFAGLSGPTVEIRPVAGRILIMRNARQGSPIMDDAALPLWQLYERYFLAYAATESIDEGKRPHDEDLVEYVRRTMDLDRRDAGPTLTEHTRTLADAVTRQVYELQSDPPQDDMSCDEFLVLRALRLGWGPQDVVGWLTN